MKLLSRIVVLLLAMAPAAWCEELTGTVASVDGYRVRITLEDVARVRLGDAVELSSEIPGVGRVAIDGTWRVVQVGSGVVVADVVGEASGHPQKGYRAVVYATGELPPPPQPAIQPPPRPPPTPPMPTPPAAAPAPQLLPGAPLPVARPPASRRGVFLAGTELGDYPLWWPMETAIRDYLAQSGIALRDLPPELPYPKTAAPPPQQVLRDLQRVGRHGWLLYLGVNVRLKPKGRPVILVECYDPNGARQWQTHARDLAWTMKGAISNLQKKIVAGMKKHHGGPCLRP